MIRAAAPADVADICALWNAVIAQTTYTFTTVPKASADVLSLLDSKWPVRVARSNGDFAGFACLNAFRSGPGYAHVAEHTVYLKPQMRGAGTGRALMTALENDAHALGISTLIGAVSGNNDAALRFHEKIGFSQVGHLPGVGRKWENSLDLILVQKNL